MFVNGKDGPLCIIRSRKLIVVSEISCVKKWLELNKFSSVMKVVRLTLEPVHVLNISSI